jgi:hypothetical protein
MKKPTNPIATTNQCIGGQKLPSDWQSKSEMRAKMADAHYLFELQNAWRGNPNAADPNSMRAARLNQPHDPVQWREILGDK